MPYRNFGKEVTRSTVCKDRWTVAVFIACADYIAPGTQSPAIITVEWRKQEEDLDDRPEDTTPVAVLLRKSSAAASGEIQWHDTADPARIEFTRVNERRLLSLQGVSASGQGAEPDVEMVFLIDGEEREIIPLRCAQPPLTLSIGLAEGEGELPDLLVPETPLQLRAIVQPATPDGQFHWISHEPDRIELAPPADSETVTVTAHEVNAESPWAELIVFFAASENNANVATARFEIVDLEQRFENCLLHRRHLNNADFRRRLEELAPADVQAFIANADAAGLDDAMRDYLQRLLAFAQTQAPLREAPTENRHNITFIMGRWRWTERRNNAANRTRTDNFYRYAQAYYEAHPDGRLVTPDDLGVPNAPSYYNPHAAIADVLIYLRNNPPPDGGRWGRINIVSHANELGGMLAFTTQPGAGDDPQEFRANLSTLRAARQDDAFEAVADDRLDVRSEIQIRGCALGRFPDAMHELSLIFGDDDAQRPQVYGPRHLQLFEGPAGWNPDNDDPPAANRADSYYNEFFLINVPEADLPRDPRTLEPRFQQQFPAIQLDWRAALRHQGTAVGDNAAYERRRRTFTYTIAFLADPGNNAAARQNLIRNAVQGADDATQVVESNRVAQPDGTFEVDYEWQEPDRGALQSTLTVGSPQFANNASRDAWLDGQQPLLDALDNMEFQHADFSWHFRVLPGSNADGSRNFEARGERYIYRVERELREPDPDNPGNTRRQHPQHTDEDHFGIEIPVTPPEHPLGENVDWEED